MQLHAIARETAFLVWVLSDPHMSEGFKAREVQQTLGVLRPLLIEAGVMEEDGTLVG